MSFLRALFRTVMGRTMDRHPGMIGEVLGGLFEQSGGLEGLGRRFQENGLGEAFSSWVGSGENQRISGEQLRAALGSDRLAGMADRLGLDLNQGSEVLADLLPKLVDRLTPGGELGGAATQQGLREWLPKLQELFGEDRGPRR